MTEALQVAPNPPALRPWRVLITQKDPTLGGSQTSLVHHLECVDRGRFAPHVVVSSEGWLTARLDEMGIPWSILKIGHWTNPLSLPRNVRLVLKLRRLITTRQIDLVHANEHWVAPVSYVAARSAGIPVICYFRTGLRDLAPSRIRKYLYGRYDRVIVVAEVLGRAIGKYLADPSKIAVIRDGVVPPPCEPRYRNNASRRIVINVGAIYRVKGQALIVEAALPWLKANPRNYLLFVGGTREGPAYVDAIKRRVAENGLERQVRFLGNRTDVPRLLKLADVLVAYSTVEGVPMVVMEAMMAGRPVIVSSTAGMDEVVTDNEVGRIVDFGSDEHEFAKALEDLTQNPDRWKTMGQRARQRAAAHYSTQAMSNAIQAVYSQLLETETDAAGSA